ncbi:MAG: hypothetical protein J6V50_04700, partial [Clostridia bacterium]|nr:hypothetical protein [Clostridia bacterium]
LRNFFGKYRVDPLDGRIDFSGKTSTVNRICDFIKETVNYFETENYVFVHGWLPEGGFTADKREKTSDALWEKSRWTRWPDKYTGERPLPDKTLVCGHVPTFSAARFDPKREKNDVRIFYGNGLIAIDAATADTKQVNVLVLEDNLL